MAFPNRGAAFPVAQWASGVDNGLALIDRAPVGNDAATVMGPAVLAPLLLTARMAVQATA